MKSENSALNPRVREESVFLFLAERCNLSCRHCYVESGPHLSSSMTFETFNRCLDLFTEAGVRDVRFTGGEPTLHPAFPEFARDARARGCRVRLITNGMNIAKRRRLLDNVDECWISIYAPTPAAYREITGSKHSDLDQLLQTFGELARNGPTSIGISVLLQPSTMEAVPSFLRIVAGVGIRRVRFVPLQPDGRGAEMAIPDPLGWRQALIDLLHRLGDLSEDAGFEILGINDVFDLKGSYSDPQDSCLLRSRRMWSIAPNGDVYTCCFNIYDDSHRIGNVWVSTYDELAGMLRMGPPACRGLDASFWGQDGLPVSCPISRVT